MAPDEVVVGHGRHGRRRRTTHDRVSRAVIMDLFTHRNCEGTERYCLRQGYAYATISFHCLSLPVL